MHIYVPPQLPLQLPQQLPQQPLVGDLDDTYEELPDLEVAPSPVEEPVPVTDQVVLLPHGVVVLHRLQDPEPVVVVQPEPVEPLAVEGGLGEIDWAVLEECIADTVQQRDPGELSGDWARVLQAVVMRGRLEQHRRLHDQVNEPLPE